MTSASSYFLIYSWLETFFVLVAPRGHFLTKHQSEQQPCFNKFPATSAQLNCNSAGWHFGLCNGNTPFKRQCCWGNCPAGTPTFFEGLFLESGLMPTKRLKVWFQRPENPLFFPSGWEAKSNLFLMTCLLHEESHFKLFNFPTDACLVSYELKKSFA